MIEITWVKEKYMLIIDGRLARWDVHGIKFLALSASMDVILRWGSHADPTKVGPASEWFTIALSAGERPHK